MSGSLTQRVMQHRVTIRRSKSDVSDSGSTTFNFFAPGTWPDGSLVIEHVSCRITDKGGRMREADAGMLQLRMKNCVFDFSVRALLRQKDLVTLENVEADQEYQVTHLHVEPPSEGDDGYVYALLEQWAPNNVG